jgi:hypothetical protein
MALDPKNGVELRLLRRRRTGLTMKNLDSCYSISATFPAGKAADFFRNQ